MLRQTIRYATTCAPAPVHLYMQCIVGSVLDDTFELDETTRDGDTDNVLHFAANETSLTPADAQACVFGSFTAGPDTFRFFGCDTVRVLN